MILQAWRRRVGALSAAGRLLVAPVAVIAPALSSAADGAAPVAGPCTLVMTEHRSERELLSAAWPSRALRVSFVHSVLGTPVEDLYHWRDRRWVLVEERFQGQGYGLAHAAGVGERWSVEGNTTRLLLNRTVNPLVIRPLPAQGMRVQLDDGRAWRLADLSLNAIELRVRDC